MRYQKTIGFTVILLLVLFLAPYAPAHAGVCGNGIVEAGEECDDGNTRDGDGCDSLCDLSFDMEVGGALFHFEGKPRAMASVDLNNDGLASQGENIFQKRTPYENERGYD
ncbi:MAG: DUF4215 domain-containing protein [bacterium]